jgi:hypothetical protein
MARWPPRGGVQACLDYASRVMGNIADLPRQYGKPEEYRFYKGGVIHVIIFHARRSLQTATDADDPVASPARTVRRAKGGQSPARRRLPTNAFWFITTARTE